MLHHKLLKEGEQGHGVVTKRHDQAADVARSVAGFAGLFVDANAISPVTSLRVGEIVGANFVDVDGESSLAAAGERW